MTIDTTVHYDFDVILWDTVGGAYTSESMAKASGGSEKEIVQLATALAVRGFRVACVNRIAQGALTMVVDGERGISWFPLSTWDEPRSPHVDHPLRCKMLVVQRYSQLPAPSQILPDRIVVRATDVYGNYYDHLSALHHLCVSEWQARAFREAGFVNVSVIPAMLDDDYYELASTPKVKGRFIYASAAMKGLQETIRKWIELRRRFPVEMADCELHVTSPGYGKIDPEHRLWGKEELLSHNVRLMSDLPPRELAKYMATCEGLFYVNTFPETFCAVAAIAEAVGRRAHIFSRDLAGIKEVTSAWATENEDAFDNLFIHRLRAGSSTTGDPPGPAHDFRVSTVMPRWIDALLLAESWADVVPSIGYPESATKARLVEVTGGNVQIGDGNEQRIFPSLKPVVERMRANLTPKERSILDKRVPVDSTFVVPDPDEKNVGSYIASTPDGKRGEMHDVRDLIPSAPVRRVGFSAEAAIDAAARAIGSRGTVAHNDLARRAQQAALSATVRGDVDARFVRLPEGTKPVEYPTWNDDQKRHWDNMTPRNKRRWLDKNSTAKTEKKMPKPQTVCLVMLAKGAETTIRRALDSVKGFVDYAVFQFDDEDSSKAMREIVLDLWPHHEDTIPVEFTYEPWVNFSINRNKLLAAAREMIPRADFQLTMDADDEFVGLPDAFKLDADFYEVDIKDGGKSYPRLMLWRADSGARYEGPAHEFVTSDKKGVITKQLFPGAVHYVRHETPMSPDKKRAKYMRDVELFVAELRKNPADTRSAYYLAQSLEDASCGTDEKLLEAALRMYLQRAQMEGFIDEKFLAWMKAGWLQKRFARRGEMIECFQKAELAIPRRAAEPIYELMLFYNNEGDSKPNAIACARRLPDGALNPPPPRGFLVDEEVYTWKFEFQYAIALFYTGQKEKAQRIWESLLHPGKAPAHEHSVIRTNLKFCEPEVSVNTELLGELEDRFVRPSDMPKLSLADVLPQMTNVAEKRDKQGRPYLEGTLPLKSDAAKGIFTEMSKRATPGFPPKSFPDPPAIDRAIIYARETGNKDAERYLVRLQNRSMAWGAGYGTHLPLLGAVLAKSSGGVLELGAGNFSTPFLSMVCLATDRELVTVEEAGEWFFNVEDIITHGQSWTRSVPTPYDWIATIDSAIGDLRAPDVCFMDHGRTNVDRIAALQHLKERDVFDFIVVHDTRNSWFAGVDECLDSFKYRYDYCLMTPVTTVVSQKHDVVGMFGR